MLQGKKSQSDDIAQHHSLADDEYGKPEEGVADGLVAGTQAFITPIIEVRSRMMMSNPLIIVTPAR